MLIEPSTRVGTLAASIPGAPRIFASAHVDYSCRGARSLTDACEAAGIDAGTLIPELERAALGKAGRPDEAEWAGESLDTLTTHIVECHHTYTRDALERLDKLLQEVCTVYGAKRPDLRTLRGLFESLQHDLRPHLAKEELILFPYIRELEAARRAGRRRPFGAADGPICVLLHDHDNVGDLLHRIRATTQGYVPPRNASASWKALYGGLQALEADLFEHVHLESNILFPRVLQLGGD